MWGSGGASTSYHTVNAHVEFLEAAFLLRRLAPYFGNLTKRLVKSPKLGVTGEKDLFSQPWVGASWEGYVIESILSNLAAKGCSHQAHYLRTSDGFEIDLVLDIAGQRWAIEVKLTSAPTPADVAKLEQTAKLVDATRMALVCRKHIGGQASRVLVTDLDHLLAVM
jgi:predicted AAA+ superfamily ATPase